MKAHIAELKAGHVEEAARVASRRFAALRARVPHLPAAYEEPALLFERIARLVERGVGVAAFDGARMVGALAGYSIGAFGGRPTTMSPEWANGLDAPAEPGLLEAMYAEVAPTWLRRGSETHAVCVLAHDTAALETWAAMGFGRIVCDAVRSLAPIPDGEGAVGVRRGEPGDAERILPLSAALADHLAAPPIYVIDREDEDRLAWEETLHDPSMAVWLALRRGSVVGYLRQGPATRTACGIIVDEKTTSITGAYVSPAARGEGIATALLAQAIRWGRDQGYVRCSVDFETANAAAARFWLSHFEPVVVSLARTHDPRAVAP